MIEQEYNISEVQLKIMSECIEQFLTRSCKDITMDGVAKAIGMSKRTIYENFENKEDMLQKTLFYYARKSSECLEQVYGKKVNPFARILQILYIMVDNIDQLSISKLEDFRKFYPNIALQLYNKRQDLFRNVFLPMLQQSMEQGYIENLSILSPEYILNIMFESDDTEYQSRSTVKILDHSFDKLNVHTIRLYLILRGLASAKGLKECDKFIKDVDLNKSIVRNILNSQNK